MTIKALVAVRSGSQRVENKNVRKFSDSNLLSIKLEQLKRIPLLNGIVVNSNDDGMLNTAAKYGVETVKRDDYYASNYVSMSDVYVNMAENFNGDVVLYANVTNPLLSDATITKAIEFFLSEKAEHVSVNSAHLVKEFMFLDNKPINYALEKQPRSQDLPDIYALNFAISILRRETMITCRNVVGKNVKIFGIDNYEAVDIDNEIDFEIAEYLYNKRRR